MRLPVAARLAARVAAFAMLAATGAAFAALQAPAVDSAETASARGAEQTLVFTALLDGRPIGEHRYAVTATEGGGRRVHSTAAFDVKFLGITAYRYRHDDTETWTSAGCLIDLAATTNDGGNRAVVDAHASGGALAIDAPAGNRVDSGCVTTFPSLYWHAGGTTARPARLLNPQDGRDEAVRIDTAPEAPIEVRGATVQARHVRIERPDGPIDLWYEADGAWIGLDALVKGKRLTYRLK